MYTVLYFKFIFLTISIIEHKSDCVTQFECEMINLASNNGLYWEMRND